MKSTVSIIVLLLVLTSFGFAEKPVEPKQVLTAGDVEHFIKTFPLLKKDLEKYQIAYDAHSGNMTYPDALKASSDFLAILKKHGWDEKYFTKTSIICLGYSAIVYGKEIKKADPEIEKSLNEIKNNPHLSDEMKKQLIDQLKAVKGIIKSQENVLQKNIHPADLEFVKPHVELLKAVFEEAKKEE